MANPQPDKFTKMSTELLEAKAKYRISGEENQIWEVVIRQIYGFQKKVDIISLSQFCLKTGLPKNSACRAINKLCEKNMIHKKATKTGVSYYIQKDFDRWKPYTKKRPSRNLVNNESQFGEKRVTKKSTTIDNKDTIQKIGEFFDYFLLKTKKQFKLTADRKALIAKRLNEGYSLEQLKLAVDNFVSDKWEGRKDNLDLIYCIGKQKGKADNLEKWMNKTTKTKKEHILSE